MAKGRSTRVWAWIGIVFCSIYMLNPDAGVFEPIPDILPGIGNLDEAGVMVLLMKCVGKLREARKSVV